MVGLHSKIVTKADLAAGKRLNALFAQLSKQKYPPVHLWNPDLCGEIDMRIARDGTWYYMGTPIKRPEMVRLFSGVLRHDDDGYYLVTPVEKLKIIVDDAPFLATSMEVEGKGEDQVLSFKTHVGDLVVADEDHPIWLGQDERGDPLPHLLVRDRLEALIARPVYYELAELAQPMMIDGAEKIGVWSCGAFFPLGDLVED
ncbi:hypothetical protein JCM17844_08560 [Iodidimonas gelatinilytica]|uniref:DUF1285 domain-containing protein n=1 Tax=Iodidimonas gelatinilytica TaxID=1236966 RepID=A0A5A7MQU2_9PROT|nr:DUF1285 domain-containing protein [Iodidimonas gelatinilytica]GEQ97219.1 hypothetical protein JCM17844_08560 [Iodidimonas gelatinilytica]GEQ99550.1 hypothetical protein JCM17845_01740 [Iodidimonas gelatinilytica]